MEFSVREWHFYLKSKHSMSIDCFLPIFTVFCLVFEYSGTVLVFSSCIELNEAVVYKQATEKRRDTQREFILINQLA